MSFCCCEILCPGVCRCGVVWRWLLKRNPRNLHAPEMKQLAGCLDWVPQPREYCVLAVSVTRIVAGR